MAGTLNGRAIRVSEIDDLNGAMLCTGFPYDVRGRNEFARHFSNFIMHAQAVRRDGAAALDLAYVACGRFDGFWEEGLRPWDVAAGVLDLVVQGTAVRVTDDPKLRRLASAWGRKWDGRWRYEVGDGGFEPAQSFECLAHGRIERRADRLLQVGIARRPTEQSQRSHGASRRAGESLEHVANVFGVARRSDSQEVTDGVW